MADYFGGQVDFWGELLVGWGAFGEGEHGGTGEISGGLLALLEVGGEADGFELLGLERGELVYAVGNVLVAGAVYAGGL